MKVAWDPAGGVNEVVATLVATELEESVAPRSRRVNVREMGRPPIWGPGNPLFRTSLSRSKVEPLGPLLMEELSGVFVTGSILSLFRGTETVSTVLLAKPLASARKNVGNFFAFVPLTTGEKLALSGNPEGPLRNLFVRPGRPGSGEGRLRSTSLPLSWDAEL